MAANLSENPRKRLDSGNQATAGLLFALAGFALLSVGDAIIKSIAGAWPGTAVALLRYVIGTGGLLFIVLIKDGRDGLRCPMPWIQFARGATVSFGSVAFFSAIYLMPLADATAIQFTSPMLAAIFSGLILGERMPRAVWVATLIAFVGVLIVLRPNFAALGWAALLPLVTAIGMSLMLVLNRIVAGSGSVLLMQLLISAMAVPVLAVVALAGHLSGWEALHVSAPDWSTVLRVAVVAGTATVSFMLIYLATTKVPAAMAAPMTYIQLLVTIALGMIVYNDRPDALSLTGATLIIGAGLWVLRRQRRPAVATAP